MLPLYYFYVITSPYRRVFVFEWSTVRTRRPRKSCVIQITSMPGRRLICVFLCQTLIHSNDISPVVIQCNRTSTSDNRVSVVSSNIDILILSILLICCMFFPFYHKVPTIHLHDITAYAISCLPSCLPEIRILSVPHGHRV